MMVFDLLLVVGGFYFFAATAAVSTPLPTPTAAALVAVAATSTMTPWAGPPPPVPTITPPAWTPTPLSTRVLAESGFPPGFTPTPRPTREPVYINLPQFYFLGGGQSVDVPVVNQILYPEPFFAPGTNSACGPVALYAALAGLGMSVDYGHLRDIAVANGFSARGISKAGLINTAVSLNNEWAGPLTIEYNDQYHLSDLTRHLRQQGVVIVLVYVRKDNGHYRLTPDEPGAVGHFVLVERIGSRTETVGLAGSTLGMEQVSLAEFIPAWTNTPPDRPASGWLSFFKDDMPTGWALILKRAPQN
jgi:hypothetical protein